MPLSTNLWVDHLYNYLKKSYYLPFSSFLPFYLFSSSCSSSSFCIWRKVWNKTLILHPCSIYHHSPYCLECMIVPLMLSLPLEFSPSILEWSCNLWGNQWEHWSPRCWDPWVPLLPLLANPTLLAMSEWSSSLCHAPRPSFPKPLAHLWSSQIYWWHLWRSHVPW